MGKNSSLVLVAVLASAAAAAPLSVTLNGRRLLVNGQPFTVQGVAYNPVPVGYTSSSPGGGCVAYTWWADRPTYVADFPLIHKMGANTIRAYGILNDASANTVLQVRAMLDAADAQGLRVILNYYPNHFIPIAPNAATWEAQFVSAVDAYKDHPAVLMWEFGNEQNLDNGVDPAWYGVVDAAAAAAKAADPNHPVITVQGECPTCPVPKTFVIGSGDADDAHMTHLDIWGVNAYRGPTFEGLFESLASTTTKPVLVAEFGKDAFRDSLGAEDQALQATELTSQWQEITANLSTAGSQKNLIGGVIFEWTDEWWKMGNCAAHDTSTLFTRASDPDPNYQEEWFGLASIQPIDALSNPSGTQRSLRKGYATMQSFWNPAAASGAGGSAGFFADTVRNYPNPFRVGAQETKFVVLTNEAGRVDIRIYDAGGQFVTSFSRDTAGPGRLEILWDGHNGQGERVSPGLYIAKIHGQGSHEDTQYRRVVAVK